MKRRTFLKNLAVAGAGAMFISKLEKLAWAFYQTPAGTTRKFIQPLRGVGPGGIPVAVPDAAPSPVTGAVHYSLSINQFQDTLHPDLGPTTLRGYQPAAALGGGVQPQKHLGGIIVAQKGVPVQLTFTNNLPATHPIPVDVSSNFPEASARFGGSGHNAITTHLHGGFVPWISDGGPLSWFTPDGNYGSSAVGGNIYRQLNPSLAAGQAEYYWPNQQSARMMWYHDHAQDITRINAYAGIATAYILRDKFEGNLRNSGLPDFIENGGREIPIVVQDKIFAGSDILTADPSWTGASTPGSLWYPHTYEPDRWELPRASLRRPILPWWRRCSATPCWPTGPSILRPRWKRGATGCACLTPARPAS